MLVKCSDTVTCISAKNTTRVITFGLSTIRWTILLANFELSQTRIHSDVPHAACRLQHGGIHVSQMSDYLGYTIYILKCFNIISFSLCSFRHISRGMKREFFLRRGNDNDHNDPKSIGSLMQHCKIYDRYTFLFVSPELVDEHCRRSPTAHSHN